jgi:hypothetical protein
VEGKSEGGGKIDRALSALLKGFVRAYQVLISSWMPPHCRFYPTCSQYMLQAVEKFGFFKGLWLGLKRLSRCHPLCEGGYDPLPEG